MKKLLFCFDLLLFVLIISCNNKGKQTTNNLDTAKQVIDTLSSLKKDTSNSFLRPANCSQDFQISWVASRMESYFHEVYEFGDNYPAPCPNAASGYWRNGLADPHFNKYGEYPKANECQLADNALKLFQCFLKFHDLNHAAIKQHDNFDAPPIIQVKLNRHAIIAGSRAVIVAYLAAAGYSNDKTKKRLEKDIKRLVDEINSDDCTKGAHANGHIPRTVAGAATDSENFIAIKFAKPNNDAEKKRYERRVLQVLQVLLDNLKKLPKGEYKPWLTADYQVTYSGLFLAAAESLKQIRLSRR